MPISKLLIVAFVVPICTLRSNWWPTKYPCYVRHELVINLVTEGSITEGSGGVNGRMVSSSALFSLLVLFSFFFPILFC